MMTNYTYLAPKDSAPAIGVNVKGCRNMGLVLERYVPQEAIDNKKEGKELPRSTWLHQLMECYKITESENVPLKQLISANRQRWLAMTEGAARFTMTTRSRMVIGLGGKGALEFGITLHPVTGLPYIPGSALKGLCRNYTLYYIAEQSEISLDPAKVKDASERAKQLDEQLTEVADHGLKFNLGYAILYRQLFGTQKGAGECVFFDAVIEEVPDGTPLFAVEVMTPHFRKYYETSGKAAPDDADNPNPVTYIAVNAGVTFRFAVGLRKSAPPETPLGDARTLLQNALKLMGIGAKTAAGYGVFEQRRLKSK